MLRQAVRTLTGRTEEPVEQDLIEDVYLMRERGPAESETSADQDGPTDRQDELNSLQSTVQQLSRNYETLNQRLSDKDRYIGQLEGENRTLRSGAPRPDAGGEPQQAPDPVLDESTAALFAEKYKESPEQALVALAEHMDRRLTNRAASQIAHRDQVQAYTDRLQAIERNILRQAELAVQNYGEAATKVVGDFLELSRSGVASAQDYARTWLGQQLSLDHNIAESKQGVYRLIELAALKNQMESGQQDGEQVDQPRPRPQSTGVARPSAPTRSISSPSDGAEEVPIEDRIGQAIVDAARGDDAAQRRIFGIE